jgi:hypothetical protein
MSLMDLGGVHNEISSYVYVLLFIFYYPPSGRISGDMYNTKSYDVKYIVIYTLYIPFPPLPHHIFLGRVVTSFLHLKNPFQDVEL